MAIFSTKLNPRESCLLDEKCVWLLLDKSKTSPIFTQLDWKMCGGLSRALQKSDQGVKPTLIPTLKRLKAEYVMLSEELDWTKIEETRAGLKLESLAIICPDEEIAERLHRSWKTKVLGEASGVRFYIEGKENA